MSNADMIIPFAYVRWTEGRNIEAFLDLLALGRIDVKPLVTHRFSIEQAADAYQLISGGTAEKYLAVLLTYDTESEVSRTVENRKLHSTANDGRSRRYRFDWRRRLRAKNAIAKLQKRGRGVFVRSLRPPAFPRATSAPSLALRDFCQTRKA